MSDWVLGVIGGSGLYALDGLEDVTETDAGTPWGAPSDRLVSGRINGTRMVFLPRHGRGHTLTPTAVPYRANIVALKLQGVTDILSVSACGSLREAMAPGDFVAVDQFIDRTTRREKSFFGAGLAGHVSLADPVCPRLSSLAADAAEAAGAAIHRGGTYLAMEGPAFSTRAESRMYRGWGADVIGMTNMPEAALAREAGLPYATLAMVTDYDSWRPAEPGVDVASVLEVMARNTEQAKSALGILAERLSECPRGPDPLGAEAALEHAVITAAEAQDPSMAEKFRLLGHRIG